MYIHILNSSQIFIHLVLYKYTLTKVEMYVELFIIYGVRLAPGTFDCSFHTSNLLVAVLSI